MSGCAICIYDLYQESLVTYRESVASLRSSLAELDIPESEWPLNIRPSSTAQISERKKDVVMHTFLEMERKLRLKREAESEKLS